MEIVDRHGLDKILDKKYGFVPTCWSLGDMKSKLKHKSFEFDTFGDTMNLLHQILIKVGIKEVICFPESAGWISKGMMALRFDDLAKAFVFLEEEILYGADNYYLTGPKHNWFAVITKVDDLVFLGDEAFIKKVSKL